MIRCITLFDITRNGDYHAAEQLKNWHTLLQSINLQSIPTIQSYPKRLFRNIDDLGFGQKYSGYEEIWMFDFEIENFDGNLSLFQENIDMIPMITGLEETAENLDHYTISHGDNQNIVFLLL
jgi:hypothetical protein